MKTQGLNRREFLRSSAETCAALVVGFNLFDGPLFGAPTAASKSSFAPNAFVRIGADDSVTVVVSRSELGQGIYTALAMIVADELDADWSKVRVEAAPVDPVYRNPAFKLQGTGGSTSVTTSWEQLRQAGATARALLIAAAAATWEVAPDTCSTENGTVVHAATHRRLNYGALVERAATMPLPETVPLKDPKDFRLIGKPVAKIDIPDKVCGRAEFGIDVRRPGMLTAVIARPPVFGGKVVRFNADKARAVPGVKAVVEIPEGVAVVATGFWPAVQGRDALEITWDDGPGGAISTEQLRKEYAEAAATPGLVLRNDGNVTEALAKCAKRLDAEYEFPYLAHTPMETLNCVADVRADSCEIWTGTQAAEADRDKAAAALGFKPNQVQLHNLYLGGAFGRRANPLSNFVCEAVHVSKAVGAPVKVIWTREDDIRNGHYRPMSHHRFSGGLDANGNPVAWSHTMVVQPIHFGTVLEWLAIQGGVDLTSIEAAADLPYSIPNLRASLHSPRTPVPVQWMRSVGYSQNVYATEAFLDELAHAGGKDPLQLRLALLSKQARWKAVVELAAEKAGWGKPLPSGVTRGIATHNSGRTYVAQVAEVSIGANASVRVHRVVCAIDCGRVINPDGVVAEMEGGTVFGLTSLLKGEITIRKGRVEQSNFHDYQMLRMRDAPLIEVYLMPSAERPSGVGERAVPAIAPAVANAILAATGRPVRRLPLRLEEIQA